MAGRVAPPLDESGLLRRQCVGYLGIDTGGFTSEEGRCSHDDNGYQCQDQCIFNHGLTFFAPEGFQEGGAPYVQLCQVVHSDSPFFWFVYLAAYQAKVCTESSSI